jgi:hypothetical protein
MVTYPFRYIETVNLSNYVYNFSLHVFNMDHYDFP